MLFIATVFLILSLMLSNGFGAELELQGDQVRVEISSTPLYQERYLARTADGFRQIARSAPGHETTFRAVYIEDDKEVSVHPEVRNIRKENDTSLVVELSLGKTTITRTIQLLPEFPYLRIENTAQFDQTPVRVAKLTDTITFLSSDPDFVWSQNLKWEENDVFPHWAFKFPALIVQEDTNFCALAADIDAIDADLLRKAPLAFDLAVDPEGRTHLSYGLIANSRTNRHHIQYEYVASAAPLLQSTKLSWAYFLVITADETRQAGFRRLVHSMWNRVGHKRFLGSEDSQRGTDDKSHLRLFDDWSNEAWNTFGPQVYHSWKREGGNVGGYSTFWISDPNVWFDAWFNSARTAYGEYLYGKRKGDEHAVERAMSVINLILSAPRPGGILPAIYVNRDGEDGWNFDHGSIRTYAAINKPPRKRQDLRISHMFDMTWTGYWLLRFHRDLLPQSERILQLCRELGDFLVTKQAPSGVVPSWYDRDLVPLPEMRHTNGETGGAALFLSELFAATGEKKYLGAAERAAEYIWREIVPTRKWFDFEAFISCSRKPFDFYDKWTRQYPANYLCIFRSAQAYFSLFEVTKEDHYLQKALWVTDFALLGQQPWSHPLFRENVFGGFSAQNSDYEWSDAREVYGAEMLFKAYEHTGELEYLERAVAAMRANFKISPLENWAHDGKTNGPTGRAKFHWGTGSGAATVEMFSGRYGDAYAHLSRGHGVGVDGCTVRNLTVKRLDSGTQVATGTLYGCEIEVDSPFNWKRKAVLVLDGLEPGVRYEPVVNGERFSEIMGNRVGRASVQFTMKER